MIPDLAVIGGGLAGAALAARTAEQGMRVQLIEREAGPHDKVCGEFLSREALLHLRALGIDAASLGGAAIDRVRLATGGAVAEVALPFGAVGLSRRVLDQALLQRATAGGAMVLRGQAVRALQATPDGVRLRLQDGQTIEAAQAVLATGKHDLRGWRRPPGRQNDLIGFKQHLRLAPSQRRALSGAVELTMFAGGYAGLQMVENDMATLCLLIQRDRLAALGGRWAAVLSAACNDAALLRRRLDDSEPLQAQPFSIAGIPYGMVAPADPAALVWRLGDQSAVIPSFTGDGMSIALHSAGMAASLLQAGARPAALQAAMRRDVGRQVAIATTLSRLAVHRPLQGAVVGSARWLPVLSSAIAAITRVPEGALQRGLDGQGVLLPA